MVASRIVEFLEDLVEEIDVLKVTEGGGNCDCPVSGV
ncbi:BnaCnng58940D [Brassica napus]|uniref:BnaCnng58940D protein n=2 Tax=Brassica TaxID=3705 RepID=A0A078JPQ0_BRANA|nr:BnaCnng58940D [Brassica napus]